VVKVAWRHRTEGRGKVETENERYCGKKHEDTKPKTKRYPCQGESVEEDPVKVAWRHSIERRGKVGRQRMRWRDIVERNTKILNLRQNDILVKDRV
jgi:hypothetical protein